MLEDNDIELLREVEESLYTIISKVRKDALIVDSNLIITGLSWETMLGEIDCLFHGPDPIVVTSRF